MARTKYNYQSVFCKVCRKKESQSQTSQESNGAWLTKPFQNWKTVIKKMMAQQVVTPHQILEAELLAGKGESIVHHLRVGDHERSKNRYAIKSFPHSTLPMQTAHSSYD